MHELSLCESVVRVCEAEAGKQGYSRVLVVRLEIGMLSCARPDSMEFLWTAATRGTLAEGSRLEIHRVPGVARCSQCSEESPIRERFDPCPRCGAEPPHLVIDGDQLRIRDLEVE